MDSAIAQQQAMMGNYQGAAVMQAQAQGAQMNAMNQGMKSVNGGYGMGPMQMGMAGQQIYAGAIGVRPMPMMAQPGMVMAQPMAQPGMMAGGGAVMMQPGMNPMMAQQNMMMAQQNQMLRQEVAMENQMLVNQEMQMGMMGGGMW